MMLGCPSRADSLETRPADRWVQGSAECVCLPEKCQDSRPQSFHARHSLCPAHACRCLRPTPPPPA